MIGYRDSTEVIPQSVSNLGQLRLGWVGFLALVVDLVDCDTVAVVGQDGTQLSRTELREVDARPPRLFTAGAEPAMTREGVPVHQGQAPQVEIFLLPNESPEEARSAWSIRLAGYSAQHEGLPVRQFALSDPRLQVQTLDGKLRVDLGQSSLLGDRPYGIFELAMLGPMGRDANFSFMVRPQVSQAADWSEWKPDALVTLRFKIPPGARLAGAEATAESAHVQFSEPPRSVHGSVLWLAVSEDGSGASHTMCVWPFRRGPCMSPRGLRTCSRGHGQQSKSASQSSKGHAPTLLLRLGTPWGIPASADLSLRGAGGEILKHTVAVDEQGFTSVDLAAVLAVGRQQSGARLDLHITANLAQRQVTLIVLVLEREWQPQSLDVQQLPGRLIVSWEERFPVEGRAIQVLDLLQPWSLPSLTRLASEHRGRFECAQDQLIPRPGMYRVSLGLDDEWTGTYRSLASKDISDGTTEDWRSPELPTASQPEAALRRLLVAHYSEADQSSQDEIPPEVAVDAGFAEKVLQARVSLGFGRERDRLSQKLSRLLWRAPLEHVLHAIAGQEASVTPRMLLELGLFLRPARMTAVIPDVDGEALWRIWAPLGAWADLRAVRFGERRVEERFLRIVGGDALRNLSPVIRGSRLRVVRRHRRASHVPHP